ncbi:MAG TPA: ferrous iron transport protein A, partial [Planctomycetes bacterium]|nr:ferrous iron transport protein A [Planctomycetota bacterium]
FGGPMLFRIHGYRLALRRSEAARVVVQSQSDSGADPGANA